MARATQPVSIDGITFDALIASSEPWESDVPSYPVEDGFEVSDAIILRPLTLSMTLFLTNTPVTWRGINGAGPSRVQDVIGRLEDLYNTRTPVIVVTSDKSYEDMAIVLIELNKDKETGPSREIPITLQHIRVAEARTTTIPDEYGRSGDTGVNAGTANITNSGTPSSGDTGGGGSRGSILHGLATGAGLFS